MKTLILLRHGKSDWSREIRDIDRPINPRGRQAASLMASWMADEDLVPDRMLVSPATRTQQTAERLVAVWGEVQRITVEPLYLAEPDEVLATIHAEGDGGTLLVLGHSPGLEMAAAACAAGPCPATMPTCTAAILRFPVQRWADVAFGQGDLMHHVSPKSLV